MCAAVCLPARPAGAQAEGIEWAIGARIVGVTIEQEGRPVVDPVVGRLAGAIVGRPLAIAELREVIARLMSLERFEDVQPRAEPAPEGVRIRYVLVPQHPVDRLEIQGDLGLREGDLRRVVTDQHGAVPRAARAPDVAATIRDTLRARGFAGARVTPSIAVTHDPDRASMVMTVEAGPRAVIASVTLQLVEPGRPEPPAFAAIRKGQPYDADAIDRQLDRYVERLRGQGYYEARASHGATFEAGGREAHLTVTVVQGPLVVVAFSGDPLPAGDRNRLVPIRTEGSADEDLLEDGARAIQEHLHAQGYRDARADYTRTETETELTITFDVTRGPRYVVGDVRIEGSEIPSGEDLYELLRIERDDPFVQRTLDQGVAQITTAYRGLGFIRAAVAPDVAVLPVERAGDATRRVAVTVTVDAGPRTFVGSVAFEGVTAMPDARLRALMTLAPGEPYAEAALRIDGDRLDREYRDRGYEQVAIAIDVTFAAGDTQADLRVQVDEGPQILVDHVIVIGNRRTSVETIERELVLRPGGPLGFAALVESRARLIALGLFRRVQIDVLAHSVEPRRDVLVSVEEADVYSIAYGGGLEGGFRLRTVEDGPEERFELAPRGFFEIGRRNLWGKNRSINLFTRVSFRSRADRQDVVPIDPDGPSPTDRGFGLNEYRVLVTYREPRIFGSPADGLLTGILEQAERTTFNFITREARAEMGWRITPRYSLLGRYVVKSTELFDERFAEEDKPLIDRVFPQVRISKVAGTVLRDTRDDLLDPSSGTFASIDTDLAARAIGSEVGFVKSYLQVFAYRRLPGDRRTVLALGARLGAAHGFPRAVPGVGEQGEPIVEIVQDLPANERFFAGGDTSVRGFSLDRLGTAETISPTTGFPSGGNAVIVLNAELRVALFGNFQGIGFVDAGNVFPRAGAFDLFNLRPSAGVGLWYRSPVGPIRLDVGFNLQPREFVPGVRERGYVVHLALGPAF